ncbi:Short-chain dehydrogenase/reductase SDR [Penicillium longicatenatum]|uniref:Short-chain dehydrogenase/reductase SDR n=1 Tax=Penicillium longicatenatum TaxID=1561947 RepID=UPI002546BF7D|nr:Short-chain dehydrogenase/reductase SDR [Penicillium longicatenatum]KAJ5639906.1 Short-chain dehydrogenase/reductase SDR [Penicillium longicatenatum]
MPGFQIQAREVTGQLTWLGDRVIATGRGRETSGVERLALKNAGAAVMELDVTTLEVEIKAKVAQAWSIYGHVDVLVNNAGYIDAGVFEEVDEASLLRSLRTNAIGPLNLSRAFLPYMRSRGTGTLLFMSSVGAYYGAAGASPYSGAKGLLEAIVPNIAAEVAPFGLRTCLLTPGLFRTKVWIVENILYRAPNMLPEYEEVNQGIEDFCKNGDGNQPGDPRKAADIIVEAVKGQGRCEGMTLPPWLPLGPDGVQAIRTNPEAKLKVCHGGRLLLLRQTFDMLHW